MSAKKNKKLNVDSHYLDFLVGNLIETVICDGGFDIEFRRTPLADAYVDYNRNKIIVRKKKDPISVLHECVHVLYDEILNESLPEREVEKTAKKLYVYTS